MFNRAHVSTESVPALFTEQAKTTPDRIALIMGTTQVTYFELDTRTSRVAAHLQNNIGLRPDTLVGSYFDNSIEAVLSMLAIMKAGAAPVLLEPSHPTERIRECIKDGGLSIVLTCEALQAAVKSDNVRVLDIGEIEMNAGRDTIPDLIVNRTVQDLAYVAYTSGSTGKPVGVLGTQRSILNGLNETLFDPRRSDEVSCINGSLNAGFQILALFLPLLTGVPLVIFSREQYRDPLSLVRGIERHRITTLVLPTPMLRQLFSLGERLRTYLGSVRIIQVGGSMVTPDLVERASALLPNIELRKAWGATEIGGMATKGRASAGLSVGKPIANTRVHVLDGRLETVPTGMIGEVYVAASHLARGYLNEPDLTQRRFLRDPFDMQQNMLMFKTGDLGRWTSDGELELLGREDDQVKIRGYRVQLSEVEAALVSHPSLVEATVVAQGISGEERLIAYIVPTPSSNLDSQQLRDHMSRSLPEYMVPSTFVSLDRLPMTETGKVDRNALPLPASQRLMKKISFVSPSNPEEHFLASVWSELLEIDNVGTTDNFLNLGGDSLFAVQVISCIWHHYDIELPVTSLFEHPTIGQLAEVIQAQMRVKAIE